MKNNKHSFTPPRVLKLNTYKVLAILFFLSSFFLSSVLGILFIKQVPPQKILSKLGIMKLSSPTDWSKISWNSCMEQLNYDADIVFIGDSLTRGQNFQSYFKNFKILNLGLSGDTINGVAERSYLIKNFNPEYIFIECGVNSFTSVSIEDMKTQYKNLCLSLKSENSNSKIFIQSILPISPYKEQGNLTNKNIIKFNSFLKELSKTYGFTYVNLYSVYEKNNEMNEAYTKDGIHLDDNSKKLWLDYISSYIK